MSLRQRAFSAVRWTGFAMLSRSALQLLQVAVLARLLAPADFGVIAMLLAVVAVLQIFSDAGISNALIHRQDTSPEQLSSLYWLNVAAGTVLAGLLAACGPLLASQFRMPELAAMLQVAGVVFLLNAMGQQLRVMSEKHLRFRSLALVEVAAAIAGCAAAIAWAWWWPGPMALAVGLLASATTLLWLSWSWLADGWRPQWRLRPGEIRGYLGFGGYTMATHVTNAVISQADIFLGARLLAPGALGLFSLPRDLALRAASVLNPIVTRVALPLLAQVQDDPARLKDIYLRAVWLTASVNFPVYAALAVFAPEIVHVLFGPQWSASAPLLRVLAAWGMIRALGNPVGSLVYARGRADLAFKWCLGVLPLVLLALWAGLHWGADGLALALLVLQLVLYVPGWWILVRPLCGAGLVEFSAAWSRPLLAVAASMPLAACVPVADSALARLAIGLALGGGLYLASSWVVNRRFLHELRVLVAPLVGRG